MTDDTPLLFPSEDRFKRNVEAVRDHLLNMSPDEMKFLKVKPKHLEILENAKLLVLPNEDFETVYMHDYSTATLGNPQINVYYNYDLIDQFDDAQQKKIACHEFGHFFQHRRNYLPGLISGNYISKGLAWVGGIALGLLGQKVAHNYDVEVPKLLMGTIGALVATPVINYSSHLCEDDADTFADKAMPEVSMLPISEKINTLQGKETTISSATSWFKRIGTILTDDHPLRMLRGIRSHNRCPNLLNYRQQHNIPSF